MPRHVTLVLIVDGSVQACNRMGYECVPLYDTLGENAIEYIIDHSESIFLVIAAAKLDNFAAALPKLTQKLLGVAYWGNNASSDALTAIAGAGFKATPFEELVASGAAAEVPADPPKPNDLCTIMYTSGTTGDPKGVMLSHSSVVATVHALKLFLSSNDIMIGPGTLSITRVCCTVLPCCGHVQERPRLC